MALDKSLNSVIVLGTVGKDPDVKTLQSGHVVGNVSIATDEGYYDKSNPPQWIDSTEWHRITAWGNLAKKLEKVKKGDVILVDGKLHTDSWDDGDGGKRYSTCIVAKLLRHVDDHGCGKAAREAAKYGGEAPQTQYQQHPSNYGGGGMPPAPEDDLPF